MYSSFPRRNRIAIRGTLTAAWLFAGAGGVTALAFPPQTIAAEIGNTLILAWGFILSIAAFVAALGALFGRYRLEWAAAWFAAAGMAPYVIAIWGLVFMSVPSRLTQALLATSLMLMFALRGVLCGAHASKLRAEAGVALRK